MPEDRKRPAKENRFFFVVTGSRATGSRVPSTMEWISFPFSSLSGLVARRQSRIQGSYRPTLLLRARTLARCLAGSARTRRISELRRLKFNSARGRPAN